MLNECWQHVLLKEHVRNSGTAVTWHKQTNIMETAFTEKSCGVYLTQYEVQIHRLFILLNDIKVIYIEINQVCQHRHSCLLRCPLASF